MVEYQRAFPVPDMPSVTIESIAIRVVAWIVPVVVRFSFPKLIAPPESVIEPSARVKLPTTVPVAN